MKSAIILTAFVTAAASAQQPPSTGHTAVNGLEMDDQVHGPHKPGFRNGGEPVAMLQGAFMANPINWSDLIH